MNVQISRPKLYTYCMCLMMYDWHVVVVVLLLPKEKKRCSLVQTERVWAEDIQYLILITPNAYTNNISQSHILYPVITRPIL